MFFFKHEITQHNDTFFLVTIFDARRERGGGLGGGGDRTICPSFFFLKISHDWFKETLNFLEHYQATRMMAEDAKDSTWKIPIQKKLAVCSFTSPTLIWIGKKRILDQNLVKEKIVSFTLFENLPLQQK